MDLPAGTRFTLLRRYDFPARPPTELRTPAAEAKLSPAAWLTRSVPGRMELVGDRMVADWWETIEPYVKARGPEDEAQRRVRQSIGRTVGGLP